MCPCSDTYYYRVTTVSQLCSVILYHVPLIETTGSHANTNYTAKAHQCHYQEASAKQQCAATAGVHACRQEMSDNATGDQQQLYTKTDIKR